jgi:hypothetical protein
MRHALMTMIAYAFLQHRRLAATAPKKESTSPRLSQLCPPCATPFSNSSLDYRRSDARIVENGFAASSGVSKSAKVALVWPHIESREWPCLVTTFPTLPFMPRHSNKKPRLAPGLEVGIGGTRPTVTTARRKT